MPRPTLEYPSGGRLGVIFTREQFATLDALAFYWSTNRTGALQRMLDEVSPLKIPFDADEQNRMLIRSPHAPNQNVHLRNVFLPGEYGGRQHLWCFDPDPETGKVYPAEPQYIMLVHGDAAKLDVASLKIPKSTIGKAIQWASTSHYRPPGWPHLPASK
jgi:hypothetical protein